MIGRALVDIGHFTQALPWCQQGVDDARHSQGDDRYGLAESLTLLGTCQVNLGRFRDAHRSFEEAAKLYDTGSRADNAKLVGNLYQAGVCLAKLGEFAGAFGCFRRGIDILDPCGDGGLIVNRPVLIDNLHQAGLCQMALGDYVKASILFHRASGIAAKRDSEGRVDYLALAGNQDHVGLSLLYQKRPDEALSWFDMAMQSWKRGKDHGLTDFQGHGHCLTHIARCKIEIGAVSEAQALLETALTFHLEGDANGRVDQQGLGHCWHLLGWCQFRQHNFKEAERSFRRAEAAKRLGDIHGRVDHAEVGASLHQIGMCLVQEKAFTIAVTVFEEAAKAIRQGDLYGRVNGHAVGLSLHEVGWCHANLGSYADLKGPPSLESYATARLWFERAAKAKGQGDVLGCVDRQSLGASLHQIGYCLLRMGQPEQALGWYQRAAKARNDGDLEGNIDFLAYARTLHGVGCCHHALNSTALAIDWLRQAVSAAEKAEGDIRDPYLLSDLRADLHLVMLRYPGMGHASSPLGRRVETGAGLAVLAAS